MSIYVICMYVHMSDTPSGIKQYIYHLVFNLTIHLVFNPLPGNVCVFYQDFRKFNWVNYFEIESYVYGTMAVRTLQVGGRLPHGTDGLIATRHSAPFPRHLHSAIVAVMQLMPRRGGKGNTTLHTYHSRFSPKG
jgi:hypothetical protein